MPDIPFWNTRHSRFMNFHLMPRFYMIFLSGSSKERVKSFNKEVKK